MTIIVTYIFCIYFGEGTKRNPQISKRKIESQGSWKFPKFPKFGTAKSQIGNPELRMPATLNSEKPTDVRKKL